MMFFHNLKWIRWMHKIIQISLNFRFFIFIKWIHISKYPNKCSDKILNGMFINMGSYFGQIHRSKLSLPHLWVSLKHGSLLFFKKLPYLPVKSRRQTKYNTQMFFAQAVGYKSLKYISKGLWLTEKYVIQKQLFKRSGIRCNESNLNGVVSINITKLTNFLNILGCGKGVNL